MAKKSVISMSSTGYWKATKDFFKRLSDRKKTYDILQKYAAIGVERLSQSTPVDTGKTAASWSYEISETRDGWKIYWNNSSESEGIPIVVLIRYGHATKNGSYVAPNDFIEPATRKVVNELCEEIWREVKD